MVLLFIHFFFFLQTSMTGIAPVESVPAAPHEKAVTKNDAAIIYEQLQGCLDQAVFSKAWNGLRRWNPEAKVLAIADLSQASIAQRFYIIDLEKKEILLQTWVAHGKNSGDNYALHFSNQESSHMSSKGFFRIEEEFISPKHGPSLLLEGLEKGLNDRARSREIIIHGADYVSERFIEEHGRCGRSYGCPALPQVDMEKAIHWLQPGSILYIHTAG